MIEKLGKYEVVEKIGVGGFGTVYKGRDPFIKRTVAIKTCQSDDDEIKKRFFREAELSGNLHHRHITTIYDFGVEEGVPYIVQEYLTGEDLDRKIKRNDAIPVERKIEILIDICDGLAYAHNAGIIHRDIKPANIRVLEDGTVKIMDFGIAKSFQSESNLTQTGITLGTAAYLAPEQIRGEPVDPRTDIFSLGVLAYELFAYKKPFKGEHISTVLFKILNEKPEPLAKLAPDVPASLEIAIERTLAKAPADRYDSVPMFRRDLALILAQMTGQPDDMAGAPRDSTAVTTISRFPGIPGSPDVTPPSGALARSPSPLETTPTPASGAVSRNVPLELVDFRDPTAPARTEPPAAVPQFAAQERRGGVPPILIVLIVLVLGGGGAFWYLKLRPAASSTPTPLAPPSAPAAAAPTPATAATPHEPPPASATAAPAPRPETVPSTSAARAASAAAKPEPPPKPKKFSVKFSSTPAANLYIDGKDYGPTVPVKNVSLDEGEHRVRLEMEDGTVYEQQVAVGPKGPSTIFHTFPVGSILVTASPEWRGAKVLVDSKARGVLPLAGVLLATPGPHDIEIVRDGIPPVIRNIKVIQGERQEIHIAPPDKAP